jgi:F-type H+-transporting ATPase subunit delta
VLSGAVARPYARALFSLAQERQELSEWVDQARLVEELLSDEVLQAAVENPQVGVAEETAIARRLRPAEMSDEAFNLCRLLIQNRRTRYASAIRWEFDELVDEATGRVRARVRTPVALDAGELAHVEAAVRHVTGREPRLEALVDPALIGGLVLQVGDRVMDMSLSTRLRSLERWINEGAADSINGNGSGA